MKLPEAVEWLERNYDEYVTDSESMLVEGDRLLRTFWFRPGKPESGGPSHRAPMFTLKFLSGGPPYYGFGTDVPPLSLESESNPLDGEAPEVLIVERALAHASAMGGVVDAPTS